jgi:GNAT superfamily N-acetyltransferase
VSLSSRRAAPAHVEPLHAILAACGRDLHTRFGLSHWDPPYPLDRLRVDAALREVHAVYEDERLVGTFTVGLEPIPEYPSAYWTPVEPALYLNRLAIHPSLQGRGLGRACLGLVEAIACERGAQAVRFDAVAAHTALLAFYRSLGYRPAGPFLLGTLEVECFEKVLP